MEAKFRGLNEETGVFVYGWYTKLVEGVRRFDAIVSDIDGTITRFYIHNTETITQYTGRHDNNNIEIYGGDELEFMGAPGMEDGTATVVWHEAEACWYIFNEKTGIYEMLYNVTGYCMVIGNMFQK
jgi:hypothetical protein